jgi:hypothetical protein
MKRRSVSLAAIAVRVGDGLRRHGIRAVLTGGACASLHSRGTYQSADMDFVLLSAVTRADLDAAMHSIGFTRRGDRYFHPKLPYYVEFPRGPLAIGSDHRIRPVLKTHRGARTLTLSATDACRDRLAAFYHWNDRQSLATAVSIARQNRVNMTLIRTWSVAEEARDRFLEFQAELHKR